MVNSPVLFLSQSIPVNLPSLMLIDDLVTPGSGAGIPVCSSYGTYRKLILITITLLFKRIILIDVSLCDFVALKPNLHYDIVYDFE